MSEQINQRIKILEQEKQSILDQVNASPALAKIHQISGAILELQQLLPKEEVAQPKQEEKKVLKFPKKKLGGKP